MSDAPKFKMRPARKFPDGHPKAGQFVPVPIGNFRTLVGEGSYPVNGAMHKAWKTGSLEIDDYPEASKPKRASKKRSSKKRARTESTPAAEATTEDPKPAEAAPTEDQS